MNCEIFKSFTKDIRKIRDKRVLQKIKDSIIDIQKAGRILEIPNIKKMEGFQNYFRIRAGDYRIGIEILKGTAYLIRFMHRKDIYKSFPSN